MKKKTKPKLPKRTKGKKSPEVSKKYIDELQKIFNQGGITYSHAAELVGCSRQFASDQFHKFNAELQEEGVATSWIEKNDAARTRAIEGLSRDIADTNTRIDDTKKRLDKAKEMQNGLQGQMLDHVLESELGEVLKQVDMKTVFALMKILGNDLNLWKNMGYYVETISNNLRSEIILKAELKQQVEIIEIMPPATELLDREIERRIAEKQHLTEVSQEKIAQEALKKK